MEQCACQRAAAVRHRCRTSLAFTRGPRRRGGCIENGTLCAARLYRWRRRRTGAGRMRTGQGAIRQWWTRSACGGCGGARCQSRRAVSAALGDRAPCVSRGVIRPRQADEKAHQRRVAMRAAAKPVLKRRLSWNAGTDGSRPPMFSTTSARICGAIRGRLAPLDGALRRRAGALGHSCRRCDGARSTHDEHPGLRAQRAPRLAFRYGGCRHHASNAAQSAKCRSASAGHGLSACSSTVVAPASRPHCRS